MIHMSKKGFICFGLGLALAGTVLVVTSISLDNKLAQYSSLAIQKADTNNDGDLSAGEALDVYKKLGFSGEDIIMLLDRPAQVSVLKANLPSKAVDALETTIGPTIKSPMYLNQVKAYNQIIKSLADKDNDGRISFTEASQIYFIAYQNRSVDLNKALYFHHTTEKINSLSFLKHMFWHPLFDYYTQYLKK